METVLITAITTLGGVVITFIFAYWFFVLQRQRQEIGYEILTSDQVDAGLSASDLLRIVINGRYIGRETDEFVPISSVYKFTVSLRNRGTADLEKPEVQLELSEGSRIVDVKAQLRNAHTLREGSSSQR